MSLLLAVATAAVYWPVVGFDFVNYDDPQFITANPHVLGGFTWENVRWALGTRLDGNWIPLTWLSYILDVELFGRAAAGLHLTNLLLHAANTVLVFLLFRRLTGAHWPSAVLAGLFGLHPLHVESVAWVAERKDVLSMFFGLFSFLFYVRYVEKSAVHGRESTVSYGLAFSLFALGLMSKPILVTLPFVFLLLDYWPLNRFTIHDSRFTIWPLLREKLPFFVLAAAAAALTFFNQLHSGAVEPLASRPVGFRIANTLISYVRYLAKTFWPVDLVNPYPLVRHWAAGAVWAAGTLLLALSFAAILTARKRPYGLTGWLWFLGTMIPVIGLVQAGAQSMADRYTYIPLLGIFWIIVWAGTELSANWQLSGMAPASAVLLVLGTCAAQTREQLNYWRDGESLFRHAIALTENNFIAFDGLGRALFNKGQLDEAVLYELKALEIRPRYATALDHLNDTLVRIEAAKASSNHSLSQLTSTDYASAYNALGLGLAMNGNLDEAVSRFQKALIYTPADVKIRSNLAYALALQGRLEDAIGQCEQILQASPDLPEAHNIFGLALLKQGKLDQAVTQLRVALQYQPDYAEAHFYLGQALAALGHRDEAIAHCKEALQLNPNYEDAGKLLYQLEHSSK